MVYFRGIISNGGAVFLFFSFLYSALVADIEAGAAEYASALVNLIRNTNIDAAFRTKQGTSAAGNTSVRNKVELFLTLSFHSDPPDIYGGIFCL